MSKQNKTTLGKELIKSIEAAICKPSTVKTVRTGVDVKTLRSSLKMTQATFASTYGFGLETLRKWEQGVNSPDRSVISYLMCIQKEPEFISKLVKQSMRRISRG